MILGAHHWPLSSLLAKFDILSEPFGEKTEHDVFNYLKEGPLILSINLGAVNKEVSGSHLILVFDRNGCEAVTAHDNACVLSETGRNINISLRELSGISNKKGIRILQW
ncbi:hypothetical protein L5876_10920 [Hyphobacterium sp. SN044]|uniref:hypothetical protein n=1 Tax=Hyphobacterium sp. SN044 TaxID=2912575 RepID=UPI001F2B34F9|nr:hypothetical protein [Hyphobacterium sp. SN044]MCF8880328.1 hypothetical protein [Hyphobacterium sp. SN044]